MARTLTVRRHVAALAVFFVACLGIGIERASAEERGAGPYFLGALATLLDTTPAEPGWRPVSLAFAFRGDVPDGQFLPVAGVLTSGVKVEVEQATLGLLYSVDTPLPGVVYTVGGYLPLIQSRARANVVTPTGIVRRTDNASGIGDVTLLPAAVSVTRGPWKVSAGVPVKLPTGEFKEGRIVNAGGNVFAADPFVGLAYIDPAIGFGASIIGGLTFNSQNPATDYRSGSLLHVEGSAQKYTGLGPGFLGLGVTGFWLNQVSDDSGAGATLGGFRARSVGVGPVVDYIVPFEDGRSLTVEAKWLPEIRTRNRVEGDYFWLKGVVKF